MKILSKIIFARFFLSDIFFGGQFWKKMSQTENAAVNTVIEKKWFSKKIFYGTITDKKGI